MKESAGTATKERLDTPHAYPSKHWRHNSPLAESLFLSLMVFLFSGILLNAGIKYVQKHRIVTSGLEKQVENFYDGNVFLWKPIHHHSDIQIYETFEHKNSTHPIYHYEYKTDVPLEAFLDVLDHPEQSLEWFAWLKYHKYLGVKKNELSNLDILSSSLNSQMIIRPLIYLHDREFLTQISSNIVTEKWEDGGGETTTAVFRYSNVDPKDEIKNAFTKSCKDCIRGAFDMVLTLTTDDDGTTTLVSMDLDMDMKSYESPFPIPRFITNAMIMRWGELSLHKLVKRCRDNLGLKNVVDIKASIMNLIPIKR